MIGFASRARTYSALRLVRLPSEVGTVPLRLLPKSALFPRGEESQRRGLQFFL